MKKLVLLLMCLVMALPLAAFAQIQVTVEELEDSITLYPISRTYSIRNWESDCYQLYTASGKAIGESYADIEEIAGGLLLVSGSDEEINAQGLVDAQGKVVLPLEYGYIEALNEDWILACVLELTTGDDYDFFSWFSSEHYITARTDVLYQGRVIGTLGGNEFRASWYTVAYGAYFGYLLEDQQSGVYIDSQFNCRAVERSAISKEFRKEYEVGVFHNPTGQKAFVPECTLTPDQVDQFAWYEYDYETEAAVILDLQGNALGVVENASSSAEWVPGGYFTVYSDGLYRLMDMTGKVITPDGYDYLGDDDGVFKSGYAAALRDGAIYYLDQQGQVTASADLQGAYNDYKGYADSCPFAVVQKDDGYHVVTAVKGLLPEVYDGTGYPQAFSRVLAVKKDGLWGVIDLEGNLVIPFELMYKPEISDDGTLIEGCRVNENDWDNCLYHLTFTTK